MAITLKGVRVCKYCGKQFFPRSAHQSFCCTEHRKLADRGYSTRLVVCEVCGQTFEADLPRAKYCCEECAETGRRQVRRERKQQQRNGFVPRKVDSSSLDDAAAEATAMGMSYGKYVAWKEGLI